MPRKRIVVNVIRWRTQTILDGIHGRCFVYRVQYAIGERQKGLVFERITIDVWGADKDIAKVLAQTFPHMKGIQMTDLPEELSELSRTP